MSPVAANLTGALAAIALVIAFDHDWRRAWLDGARTTLGVALDTATTVGRAAVNLARYFATLARGALR